MSETRRSLSEGSGFIQHNRAELLSALQCITLTYQHAEISRPSNAHHHRHRCGEAQRTGTRDDQHSQRRENSVTPTRLRTIIDPDKVSNQRNQHHHRNKYRGYSVCQTPQCRFSILCLPDRIHNLRKTRFSTYLSDAHQQAALLVLGATRHTITGPSAHRNRLTREHRLINVGLTLNNFGINGYSLTRTNTHQIAWHQHLNRDLSLLVIAHAKRVFGLQVHQFSQS